MTSISPDLLAIWESYASALRGERGDWPQGAVYLRESRAEQAEGFSPGAQLKGTLEEAVRRKLWVPAANVFLDLMSGRREDRVAFQDMLTLARSGKLAAVIVLHTSRWARNAMVSRKYKDELRRRGVEVIATNAPFDVARPEGKFAERMMEAVDEFTSDTIGWWVGVGLREKHERGEPLGRLPEVFYRDARGKIVPHPELSAIVLEGARRYATGRVGFGDLAGWATSEGYRTPAGRALSDEWWRNVLGNPTIAGYVGYHRKRGGTELRQCSFAGFVSLDLFQRVQEVRRFRSRLPRRSPHRRVYLLTGLARCATCDGQVTASAKERLRCRRAAEHAGCPEPSVRAAIADEDVAAFVRAAFSLPAMARTRVAALVRAKVTRGANALAVERVRGAIKRLTDAYTWGGADEAEYRAQLAALHEQLAKAERAPDERRIMDTIRVAQDLAVAWDRTQPERRRQMLTLLFERVTVGAKRLVAVRPREEVKPLLAIRLLQSGGPDRIRTGDLVLDRDVC